jgi:nucleolin
VFVRNLIFDATDKHLWAAFEKFGEVVDCHVARDARGLSKGYGFVYFKDADSVQQAVSAVDGTFWHGRRVACSPRTYNNTNNSSSFAAKNKSQASEPSTTLYIGNIPYETTDAELNNIFKNLKNVTDIRVAVDRTTGWPRGFAHADFANVDSAIEAYKVLQGMQLGNRTLSVDYSESRKFVRNMEPKTRS